MEQFKVITSLYIFLLLIALGFALAVALAFPELTHYSFAAAFAVHSLIMFVLFWQYMTDEQTSKTNEPD